MKRTLTVGGASLERATGLPWIEVRLIRGWQPLQWDWPPLQRTGVEYPEYSHGEPACDISPAMRDKTDAQRHRCMRWAQRLKRVFQIEIDTCLRCGGRLRVIASIEEPSVIDRILAHLGADDGRLDPAHPGLAPPRAELLF